MTRTLRPLKVGPTEGDRVQVLDGLAADERVVVDGVDKLRDGAPVELIDAAARGGAAGQGRRNGTPGAGAPPEDRKSAPGAS